MADGRIIVSADSGINWQPDTRIGQSGAVTAFWVDPADPRIALAVFASHAHGPEGIPPRVLHTIDGGLSWDDISANLPDVTVRGVTADPVGQCDLRRHRSGRLLGPDKSQRVERRARFLDRAGRLAAGCARPT